MNENDLTAADRLTEGELPDTAASDTAASDAAVPDTVPTEIPAENPAAAAPAEEAAASASSPDGEAAPLSESEMAALLANPMFIPFARGRKGELSELCRDFHEMLAAGGIRHSAPMTASVTARMTPTSVTAVPEVALSERQRSLARAAGMTYREYYELASGIPDSIHDHKI